MPRAVSTTGNSKKAILIDKKQLKKLNFKALTLAYKVTINVLEYGDIIEDLDFTLSKKAP
jgi:hypothetical protein